jgi:hypothetical protein
MNELLPIIRRKRRPLVMSEPHKPSNEELNRTDATDGTDEARESAGASEDENEKESDADVSTEGEAN